MIAFYQENREILYIIGQIMSLSGPVIGFFVFYSKTRKQILTAKLSLDIMNVVQQALVGMFTGSLICCIMVFREIVFYFRGQKKWASHILWLPVFLVLTMLAPAFTWEGPVSLLPTIGSVISVLSFNSMKPSRTRFIGIFAHSFWLVYTIVRPNIGGIIANVVQISAAIAGLIRDRKEQLAETK